MYLRGTIGFGVKGLEFRITGFKDSRVWRLRSIVSEVLVENMPG